MTATLSNTRNGLLIPGDFLLTATTLRTSSLIRSIFDSVGGFDTSVNACADYDLCLRIARRFPVYCHGKVVAKYRVHGESMSHNYALMLGSTLKVLRSQRGHTKGNKRYEEALKMGVRVTQDYYGFPLVSKVRVHAREREWKQAMRGMLVLLRHYPRVLVRAWQKLRSSISSRR